SAIIAFCRRRRSASNSSSVLVGATRSKGPKMTRALENGRGRMNLSQLLALKQIEYSILIGWIGAPVFWAKKMIPRPSSSAGRRENLLHSETSVPTIAPGEIQMRQECAL